MTMFRTILRIVPEWLCCRSEGQFGGFGCCGLVEELVKRLLNFLFSVRKMRKK